MHAQGSEDGAINEGENVRPADEFRNPRGEQDPHARILVPGAGGEIEARAHGLCGELRQRRVPPAQLGVIGQLIGQAGDVRQQVANRHVVPPVARKGRQEPLHAVIKLKPPSVEQRHDGSHVDWLGNGAEQEHRVVRAGLAEVARERLAPLHHVQHRRVHLLPRRGLREHLGRVLPPLPVHRGDKEGAVAPARAAPRNVRRFIAPVPPPWRKLPEVASSRNALCVTYQVRLLRTIPPLAGARRENRDVGRAIQCKGPFPLFTQNRRFSLDTTRSPPIMHFLLAAAAFCKLVPQTHRHSTAYRTRCLQSLLILAFLVCASGFLQGITWADWPNWRGPAGNGSVATGSYPTSWKVEDVSWKFALPGKGTSTPIFLNERIYLTSPDNGQDTVLALDMQGKLLWRTPLRAQSDAKHRTLASSCNASPVTDGKGIFVYFRSGRLAALELDGSVRWINDIAAKFGRDKLFWDQGTSPVVTDSDVILTRMHAGESWIAGFDKVTGTMRWRQRHYAELPNENNNAYTTPVFFQHNGRPALLVWGADHLTAHSAADGSVLWTCDQFNPGGTANWPAIASPVISGNLASCPSAVTIGTAKARCMPSVSMARRCDQHPSRMEARRCRGVCALSYRVQGSHLPTSP